MILLTARAQQSDVQTGFDSGADDYITKPFSPSELASRRRGAADALRGLIPGRPSTSERRRRVVAGLTCESDYRSGRPER